MPSPPMAHVNVTDVFDDQLKCSNPGQGDDSTNTSARSTAAGSCEDSNSPTEVAAQPPAAAQPEFPTPWIVKNTFIDTETLRSASLELFYKERQVQSCFPSFDDTDAARACLRLHSHETAMDAVIAAVASIPRAGESAGAIEDRLSEAEAAPRQITCPRFRSRGGAQKEFSFEASCPDDTDDLGCEATLPQFPNSALGLQAEDPLPRFPTSALGLQASTPPPAELPSCLNTSPNALRLATALQVEAPASYDPQMYFAMAAPAPILPTSSPEFAHSPPTVDQSACYAVGQCSNWPSSAPSFVDGSYGCEQYQSFAVGPSTTSMCPPSLDSMSPTLGADFCNVHSVPPPPVHEPQLLGAQYHQTALPPQQVALELKLADALPEPELGTAEMPSLGSRAHRFGGCRPCAFFHTRGCENAVSCEFCHLCDSGAKKRRLKQQRVARRAARAANMVMALPLGILREEGEGDQYDQFDGEGQFDQFDGECQFDQFDGELQFDQFDGEWELAE